MNEIIYLVLILVALELFEAYWQHSETIGGVLANGYYYYSKSVFLLFLMHPSLYFVLFVLFLTNSINGWIITILFVKSVDMLMKIALMRSLFVYGDLDQELKDVIDEPITPWLFAISVGVYPTLLYFALV